MSIMLSDEEALMLIKKTSMKDEEAFHRLYEKMGKIVYFYLQRLMKNENMAEEIMVQTFTEVWRSSDKFRGQSKVTTWVIGIARNLALKEFRDIKKHGSHDDIKDHKHLFQNGNPSDFSDKKEILKNSMKLLSDKHREVLDMFFFLEMSYSEISKTMGISINTVKSRIFYAKRKLKGILKKAGIGRNEI